MVRRVPSPSGVSSQRARFFFLAGGCGEGGNFRAENASELKVLWPLRVSFNWSGPVLMRRDPRSPHRVEFETVQWDGDVVRVRRLFAVMNDPLTTVTTLLSRLRDKR